MKKLLFTLTLLLPSVVMAQVGIDNPNPHPSAVLDLAGDSNSTRGLLIPTTTPALVTTPTANGLLIFDETDSKYHFWHEATAQWLVLNPWESPSTGNHIAVQGKQVGIGTTTPDDALDVVGNIEATDSVKATNVTTSSISTSSINIPGFSENAFVPSGGIIMWSGYTAPTGWKLCDGTNNTPDLRGRFVVGFVPAPGTEYNQPGNLSMGGTNPGNTGGQSSVTLTIDEMPTHVHDGVTDIDGAHSHSISLRSNDHSGGGHADKADNSNAGSFNTSTNGNHDHEFTTDPTGGSQPHENRPPFYVLAYIMKI